MKIQTRNSYTPRTGRGQGGFTLIEIIVTIAVAAIMGVFFAQFIYTGVIHSADPVRRMQNMSSATHIMEYMTADYKRLAATQSNFLSIFKDFVQYGNEAVHPDERAGYPYWGSYEILSNKYVLFNSSTGKQEADDGSARILKVTIRCGDQTVTALFTR